MLKMDMKVNPFGNSFYADKNINLPFFELPDPAQRIRSSKNKGLAGIEGHLLIRPTLKSKAMGESGNQGADNQRRREDEKFIEETNFFQP